MRILLVDDPMGNLSSLEEQLTKRDMQVVKAWDVVEARKRISSEPFDAMIASSVCVSGDPIDLCLGCSMSANHPVLSVLYIPYQLKPDEEAYLKDRCVDSLIKSSREDEIIPLLAGLAEGKIRPRASGGEPDRARLA